MQREELGLSLLAASLQSCRIQAEGAASHIAHSTHQHRTNQLYQRLLPRAEQYWCTAWLAMSLHHGVRISPAVGLPSLLNEQWRGSPFSSDDKAI